MQTIILSGMRGTGKSTIGKKLAKNLSYNFIDLDKFMDEKIGSITSYIYEKGWDAFRDLEYKTLKEVLNLSGNKVISLGGGTIIFDRNIEEINKLKNIKIFFLETDLEIIAQRIEKDEKNNQKRNSLTGKGVLEELKEVYAQREKIYKKNCDFIIDNNGKIEETITNILRYKFIF